MGTMTHLRLVFASLVFATAASACTPSTTTHVQKPEQQQTQLDRAAVRAKLAARREVTFQRFLDYRNARVYPLNTLPGGGFQHVWLDPYGNLCAAATLVSKDWGRDAAIRAGAKNNQMKLADIKSGPLADWILTTGMTHHELVAIQAPGVEVSPEENMRWQENERLYGLYIDVERQLKSLWNESLDDATDALMKHPDLARQLLQDKIAGPGVFGTPNVAAL
jgi:hypothetical protein